MSTSLGPVTLSRIQIEEAGRVLADARARNVALPGIPEAVRPRTLADAYAVQDALVARLGRAIGGWFCACTNPEIQRLLGLPGPYHARLFADVVLASPAHLRLADHPSLALECEFAFVLGRDLPARPAPYSRDEVEAAIATVHPAIEVVVGHLRDWPRQDVYSVIADNGTDGALVFGPGRPFHPGLALARTPVTLRVNGRVERKGTGAAVLGDPVDALAWLANARREAGEGLRARQIHNTGTATSIYWPAGPLEATAEFGPLGSASLRLV